MSADGTDFGTIFTPSMHKVFKCANLALLDVLDERKISWLTTGCSSVCW